MTIKEFYEAIGENYDEILNRFMTPERITKYVRMFTMDDSFKNLEVSLLSKDYDLAFRMVHTLKGVSANLGFMKLYDKSVVLTELLRNKEFDSDLMTPFVAIKDEYTKIMEAIGQLA